MVEPLCHPWKRVTDVANIYSLANEGDHDLKEHVRACMLEQLCLHDQLHACIRMPHKHRSHIDFLTHSLFGRAER